MSVPMRCRRCGHTDTDHERMEHHMFVAHHIRVGIDPVSGASWPKHLDEEHDSDWCGHEPTLLVCARCGEYLGDGEPT